MSLSNVLREMEVQRPHAEMDITLGVPETYGSRVGLKRAGEEAMKRLRIQYRDELKASTMFIVVTGAGRDNFTQLATSDTFGCFSADPDEFFKDLASRVTPSLFGRESAGNLFKIANNILFDKLLELDILSDHMILFSDKYNLAVNSVEDFVPLVRSAVVDQVGSEVVGINAIHSVVNKAIEKKHAATVTPVVLSTSDEKFALDLQKNLKRLKTHVFLVAAGKASKALQTSEGVVSVKTVSEESVGEALTAIRSKVL
jgi:hypothetical protein